MAKSPNVNEVYEVEVLNDGARFTTYHGRAKSCADAMKKVIPVAKKDGAEKPTIGAVSLKLTLDF